MTHKIASFTCPKIMEPVSLELGYATEDICTKIGACSGALTCGVAQQLPGKIHYEWLGCPVVHPRLALPQDADIR